MRREVYWDDRPIKACLFANDRMYATMTLSKPSWYLDEYVIGAAQNFRRQPGYTMALAAVEQVYHFADRVYQYCQKNKLDVLGTGGFRTFRDKLIEQEPDLALADRVANAGKHHMIERKGVVYTATGQFILLEGVWWIADEHGRPLRAVDEFLTSAIGMWQRWLQAHPDL